MFVRYRKIKNGKTRVQIVESYRVNNKVVQKVLRHVGTAKDDPELEAIKKIAEHLKETIEDELRPQLFTKEQLPEKIKPNRLEQVEKELPALVNIHHLREEKRITTGFHDIYGRLFDEVGYGTVLKSSKVSAKIFKDVVMARLSKPVSKLASREMLDEKFGKQYGVEQIYRMLDSIKSSKKNAVGKIVHMDKIQELQEMSYQYAKRLLDDKITLFFYDCTTLYFESFTEDELRRFGYSKDHKFNQGQVLLALLVTEEGLPVGYEVFPGNMYEGDTFKNALEKIKEKYGVKEAVIVADSGLLSEKNILLLKSSGYQYILGARLKNLSKDWQNTILENTDYETRTVYYKDKEEKEKDVLKIKDYDYPNPAKSNSTTDAQAETESETESETKPEPCERLIISRSSARAKKDKSDREKALKKLLAKLSKSKNPTDLISNFGYKKYLKIDGKTSVSINQAKVDEAELWDGLHGVFTNTDRSELNAYVVLNHYHGLWQVEDSFRINKHDLRIRPVFHWNPDRIKAHIAICFVSFSLIRFLQHHIYLELGERFSALRISIELNSVQESVLYDVNKKANRYVIPSRSSDNVLKIYRSMKRNRSVVPYVLRE
jgi:transposase